MFTSFRFKNRQMKLCDEHTPRHGFAAAIGAVRAQGNMPWPLTSSETQHVLGRFTAGIVKEVYTPWFGAYQAAGGGGWKSSAFVRARRAARAAPLAQREGGRRRARVAAECAHPETQWDPSAAELILVAAAGREHLSRTTLESGGAIARTARCT
jgi:hypothetical protein